MTHVYLDHAAATPILPEARAAMAEACLRWANPSSSHAEGRAARAALEDARMRIKAALGWNHHLIFTSGASEAAAIALNASKTARRFVSAVEHDAVRKAAPDAEILPVGASGLLAPAMIDAAAPAATFAVQSVNSETGVVQTDAGAAIRARGGVWLADCAQSAGKLPLPDADLLIVSAHKLGGLPGIGALLVRDLALLVPTGGQEQGYRAGTENLPGAMSFAAALESSRDWLAATASLREALDAAIVAAGGEIVGAEVHRLPTVGSYRMPGHSARAQLIQLDLAGFAVSAGSACSSGALRPSPVLTAMGWPEKAADEVIRVSFGWTTTPDEVARFADAWTGLARGVRVQAT